MIIYVFMHVFNIILGSCYQSTKFGNRYLCPSLDPTLICLNISHFCKYLIDLLCETSKVRFNVKTRYLCRKITLSCWINCPNIELNNWLCFPNNTTLYLMTNFQLSHSYTPMIFLITGKHLLHLALNWLQMKTIHLWIHSTDRI